MPLLKGIYSNDFRKSTAVVVLVKAALKKLTDFSVWESFQSFPKDLWFCIPYIHSKMNGEK